MKVLSLNCGSSSLRWGLFDFSSPSEIELAAGSVEEVYDPAEAWERARPDLEGLAPDAVGHRVVHGGEHFTEAVRIDGDVLRAIEAVIPLAPVHNPRSLLGIREAQKTFPTVPHVAVFDTAFHQSMPPEAYHYALPYSLFETYQIRRYGFHGSSHRYASECAAQMLGEAHSEFFGITIHLGGGCSIAAIKAGRSIDTSMGMTPLEGLMMGTRSGDLDPAIVLDLAERPGFSIQRVRTILNEESGLLGVSGVSSDLRQVEDAAAAGNERAKLALDLFAHRTRRGIGAALFVLGGAQAIDFTVGIGEHASDMRERILENLDGLGLELDHAANQEIVGRQGRISTADSPIAIFVIPAREEWLIARETAAALA